MTTLQRCSSLLLTRRLLLKFARAYNLASSNHPANFTAEDLGKLYRVDQNSYEILRFKKNLPVLYSKTLSALNQCVWLCRSPLLEAINCMRQVSPSALALRIVLWGQHGTGKTTTLNQLVHYAHNEGFVIVHIPRPMHWNRVPREHQLSTYKPNRIDIPTYAVDLLQNFKEQNQPLWAILTQLKTERDYVWSKVEKTLAERPLIELVEMGLSAPFSATDCVGALFRELKRHASSGAIKVMVAIDKANSLYGKTTVKKPDFARAKVEELSLPVLTRKFFQSNWTNGVCVLVADKSELSDPRDKLTIALNTPFELFSDEGLKDIDPYVAIETLNYTKEEADAIYNYYSEIDWLTQGKTLGFKLMFCLAKTPEAREQLYYLSGTNPYNYERLCSFT